MLLTTEQPPPTVEHILNAQEQCNEKWKSETRVILCFPFSDCGCFLGGAARIFSPSILMPELISILPIMFLFERISGVWAGSHFFSKMRWARNYQRKIIITCGAAANISFRIAKRYRPSFVSPRFVVCDCWAVEIFVRRALGTAGTKLTLSSAQIGLISHSNPNLENNYRIAEWLFRSRTISILFAAH